MRARPLQTGIIYGPVNSRRLGRSLGVNILPTRHKVCSFDCLYCQYGWTASQSSRTALEKLKLPGVREVEKALTDALPSISNLDAITLAGNGEPSLHPSFTEIAQTAARLRDRYQPKVPVCILSNSSTIDDPRVQAAFEYIDRKIMKLDVGTQATFQKVNRPGKEITLEKIVQGLARIKPVEIQTLFFEGPVSNALPEEVEAWIGQLARINPAAVQVYTLDRIPADKALRPLSAGKLEKIAGEVRTRLPGVKVQVY
ncbi:MAG TPA: radical SAM protein [archaeon]|nr:radical SAM protein [archaeon]